MARATDWIDTLIDTSVAGGAQSLTSLMTGVVPVNVRRQTLIRTILMLELFSATIAGAWGTEVLDIGIGITSQEAFAASVVADPNVANDQPSRGWIYRTRRVVAQNGIGGSVIYTLHADIRASRKLDDGECFIVMNATDNRGTAFSVVVVGLIRQLWLLP